MRKKGALLAIAAAGVLALVFHVPGCGGSRREGKPVVACTTPVLADFVRTVGGPHVEVRTLAAPLEDPHMVASTPELVRAVAESWAVFENGFGLEPWLDGLLKSAAGEHRRYMATKGVSPLAGADGQPDPHAWMDPRRAITYVENARDMLIDLDPDHETDFRSNADALIDAIKGVEAYMTSELEGIAPKRRRLLLVHDSLRYFGARFGFETRGLAPRGVPPTSQMEKEATDWLGLERTPAMFVEAGHDEVAMRDLSPKIGRNVGGPLWTDTLDAPGKPAGSYVGAMKDNVQMLIKVLR